MCGIMGIVGEIGGVDAQAWGALTRHRGPDAFGVWASEHVLLCHNRLSIIDLSAAANQPMHDTSENLTIVFNGEIFNYLDLRDELIADGVEFRTRSDTEVVLQGYRQWGRAVLDRLDGMFAFAIWDNTTRTLFAARDHIGIKPFFYRQEPGRLIFGSELKLIASASASALTIRDASIYEYLAYSYIPAPFTIYDNVLKLEPGHWLHYSLSAEKLETGQWWAVPKPSISPVPSVEANVNQLREIFGRSVRRRMISDVPIGAFLSGGVDSSAIVAEMANAGGSVQTFSIGYRDNPDYDETEYAQLVARHLGVNHKVLYPDFDQSNIEAYLDLVVDHFDEPYGNPTVAMVHLLTAAARDHVTVALVGDGGDELFAGYPRHRALRVAQRTRPLLGPFSPYILAMLRLLPEQPGRHHLGRRARQFFEAVSRPAADAFQAWSSVFPLEVLHSAAVGSGANPGKWREDIIARWFSAGGSDDVSNALYADLNSFLPYNLLEGADRMSMANGFELRVPFVSRELIEFAATLPPNLKIDGATQKFLLKQAYKDALPEAILRRPKRGFNPPVWHWLQANEAFVRARLGDSKLARYLHPDIISHTVNAFYTKSADNSLQLWMLLVLGHWLTAATARA